MMATGMEDGAYALGGQPVTVKGNLALLDDGTIAGSATNLYDCMRTAIHMGVPKEDAVRAATINPAKPSEQNRSAAFCGKARKRIFL